MNVIKIEEILKNINTDELVLVICKKLLTELKIKSVRLQNDLLIASAILYIAQIKIKQPKSLDEISALLNCERTGIGRMYKKIKKALKMVYCKQEKMTISGTTCITQIQVKQLLQKYLQQLNLSEKVNKKILLLEAMTRQKVQQFSYSPVILALAYISLGLEIFNKKQFLTTLSQQLNLQYICLQNVRKKIKLLKSLLI